MRCYHHSDREATAQCENWGCTKYLCSDCIRDYGGWCYDCAITHYRNKRENAKNSIKLFKIGAVIGAIAAIVLMALVSISAFSISYIELSSTSILSVAIITACAVPLAAYIFGGWLMGVYKTFWALWNYSKTLTVLFGWFIIPLGMSVCALISPVFYYSARKTLRETAWVDMPHKTPTTSSPPQTLPIDGTPETQAILNEFTLDFLNKQLGTSYGNTPPKTSSTTNTTANYCKYCGNKNDPDSVYCKKCGKQI